MLKENQLDIAKHHMDGSSILNWILDSWKANPNAELVVITSDGDGLALVNRIRANLSIARGTLREQNVKIHEFGIRTQVMDWDTEYGEFEAVTINRTYQARHVVKDMFAKLDFEKIGKE